MRQSQRNLLLAAAAIALAMLAGCPQNGGSDDAAIKVKPATTDASAGETQYPIPLSERPYNDIHQSAKDAWFLVETAYYVVKDKYVQAAQMLKSEDAAERKRGSDLRAAVSQEIEDSIFLVNPSVEQLFIDAMQAEPENPLNIASYAYYLKPRKREVSEETFVDTEPDALAMMDEAIKLWPDEASFYLLKVHIMTQAHKCHDWLRSQMAQDIVITQRLPEIRELLTKAKKYYPDNAYINYYHAMLAARYNGEGGYHSVHDEVMREIRDGNRKAESFFFYPPPLPPFPSQIRNVELVGTEKEAKYVDQWNFFGHYDPSAISMIINGSTAELNWPEDKEDVAALMLFLYKIGKTLPFDRTMISLQLRILNPLLEEQEPGSEEALKLAEAIRYLNEQYRDIGQKLYQKGYIEDPTMIDVRGINSIETTGTHLMALREAVQGPQASFLLKAGEILDLEFPLPADPKLW